METAVLKDHDLTLSQGKLLLEIHKWVGKQLIASTETSSTLGTQTIAIKHLAEALIDSKHSVDDSRAKLSAALEELSKLRKDVKDITGEHPLMVRKADDAPVTIHVVMKYVTNFTWKQRKHIQRAAVAIATAAWLWAAPHVYAAVKLLWRG